MGKHRMGSFLLARPTITLARPPEYPLRSWPHLAAKQARERTRIHLRRAPRASVAGRHVWAATNRVVRHDCTE